MERDARIELATSDLEGQRSTSELIPQCIFLEPPLGLEPRKADYKSAVLPITTMAAKRTIGPTKKGLSWDLIIIADM